MPRVKARTAGRRKHNAKCLYCSKRHGDGAPFWNKGKNGWSITTAPGRSRLIAKGWEGHDEAIQLWQNAGGELRQQAAEKTSVIPVGQGDDTTVGTVCELYLNYLERTASPKRHRTSRSLLNDLCFHPTYGMERLTVADLRQGGVARVKQWADAHHWQNGTKELAFKTIKAAFNHCGDRTEDSLSLFKGSPVAKLNTGSKRVKGAPRETVFNKEQTEALLKHANPQLSLALKVLILTGCRPEELCALTAEDVKTDPNGKLYWHVKHKNIKRTGAKRRVWLTKMMQEITAEQLARYPSGPIFRNTWGQAWRVHNLLDALRLLTEREPLANLGLNDSVEIKRGSKTVRQYRYVVYTCRHTFAFRWLTGFYKKHGKPIIKNYDQVAVLMGNTAEEVRRTYGHLVDAVTFIQDGIDHD